MQSIILKIKSSRSFTICSSDLRTLRRLAKTAQELDQSEVCGLLLSNDGSRLELRHLPNQARKPGRWLVKDDVYAAEKVRAHSAGKVIVGSFHSHPVSEAIPGSGDIQSADAFAPLMLIYDVCGQEAKLWRVRTPRGMRQAEEVNLDVIRTASKVQLMTRSTA